MSDKGIEYGSLIGGGITRQLTSERELSRVSMREQKFIPLALRGLELALQRRTSLNEVLTNVVPIDSLREIRQLAAQFITRRTAPK